MKRRSGVALVASIAALVVAAGVAIWALAARGHGGSDAPLPELQGQATWPPRARPAPGFELRDQAGRATSLSSLRGRTILLAFLDSRCRGACAREPHTLATALRLLPRPQRPVVLVVSVDPGHDSAGAARAAMKRWGLAGEVSWRWLLGSRSRLARVWRSYRIATSPSGAVRSRAVYLIDRGGFERAGLLYPFSPDWPAGDLRALAGEG